MASEPSKGPQMGQGPVKWPPNGPTTPDLFIYTPGPLTHLGASRELINSNFWAEMACTWLRITAILYYRHFCLSLLTLVAGAWTEREKMFHGGSFLKLADDNMDIQNPEAQNRELSGFWEKVIFLPFPHEKTTFQWPKVVSEAIFPTNRGYICIEKWSQIFVSGIGSVHSESEEKSLFKLKKGLFLTFRMGTSNARKFISLNYGKIKSKKFNPSEKKPLIGERYWGWAIRT